jgi:DNA repair protein RadC
VNSDRIRSWPAKERPRERRLDDGPERLTDAELLAIILRVGSGTFKEGIPGKNAYTLSVNVRKSPSLYF